LFININGGLVPRFNQYLSPKVFIIKQSSLLCFALSGMHVLAIVVTYLNKLDISVRIAVIFIILISLIRNLKREFQFQSISIRISSQKGWQISFGDSCFITMDILPSTVISPYFIVLHFKQQQMQKQTLFILKDALVDDEFRKLVVQLKISGLKNIK